MKLVQGINLLCGQAGIGKTRYLIDTFGSSISNLYCSSELSSRQQDHLCDPKITLFNLCDQLSALKDEAFENRLRKIKVLIFDPLQDFLGSEYNEVEESFKYLKNIASKYELRIIGVVYPSDGARNYLNNREYQKIIKGYSCYYNSARLAYYLIRKDNKLLLLNVKNNWGTLYEPVHLIDSGARICKNIGQLPITYF